MPGERRAALCALALLAGVSFVGAWAPTWAPPTATGRLGKGDSPALRPPTVELTSTPRPLQAERPSGQRDLSATAVDELELGVYSFLGTLLFAAACVSLCCLWPRFQAWFVLENRPPCHPKTQALNSRAPFNRSPQNYGAFRHSAPRLVASESSEYIWFSTYPRTTEPARTRVPRNQATVLSPPVPQDRNALHSSTPGRMFDIEDLS